MKIVRGAQDYKRLELIETDDKKTERRKKTNRRKTVHLSVLDKVKGLSSEESNQIGKETQVEITLRLWSKGSVLDKGGDGRSIQIVNKGKRKRDRGVEFVKEYDKNMKERTGSYTRMGWKDIKGRKKVNQVLHKRGEQSNWKRRGRGRRETELYENKRRWLNMDRRNQSQMKEMRSGRSLITNTDQDADDEVKMLAMLKKMYRRVLMKGVLMQMWSMILIRGTRMEKDKTTKKMGM